MFNKREALIKLGTMVMAFAPIVPFGGSSFWLGEPKLPKKLQK